MVPFVFYIIIFFSTQGLIKDNLSKLFLWGFSLLWCVQIILSLSGFYALNIPNNLTIAYLSIHLFFFYLGFCILRIEEKTVSRFKALNDTFSLDQSIKKLLYSKLFLLLFALSFVYIIQLFFQFYTRVLFLGTLGESRTEYFEGMLGPIYIYTNKFFLEPAQYLLLFIFGYLSLKKRNWLWLFIGVYLFMYYSLGGGRLGYLRIVISILLCVFVVKSLSKKSQTLIKTKYVLILAVVIAFFYVVINYVTFARLTGIDSSEMVYRGDTESTNAQLYTYYVGPISAFDYSINHDYPSKIGGYKYGALTFAPFEEMLSMTITRFVSNYKRPLADYVELIQDKTISIGSDVHYWNALYTWCNYFYCDFGVFGLIIFPLMFGVLARSSIRYFYRRTNVYSGALLCYVFICLCFSGIFYSMHSISNIILIFALIALASKEYQTIISKNGKHI